MATITAKYRSVCAVCGNTITPGQSIEYVKGTPIRHERCTPPAVPPDAISISVGSGYAPRQFSGWQAGQVIVNPNRPRCPVCQRRVGAAEPAICPEHQELAAQMSLHPEPSEPAFLYVLTASRRYVREDGLSFGVGDENGYLYSAVCRAATEEESQPLRQQVEAAARRREATATLTAIFEQIVQAGEVPSGAHDPEGEKVPLGRGQDLYGGAQWFVLGPKWIWAVTNNGRDGDDWSRNNVRTGGAGAIGRRIPFDAQVAEAIHALGLTATASDKG